MKTTLVCSIAHLATGRWLSAALAAILVLGDMGAANAGTYVLNAWGNSNAHFGPPCNNPPASSLQLNATRNPADGRPPFQGNKLLMLSDVSYTQPAFNCIESTTWTSASLERKAASVEGAYQNPNPISSGLDDFFLPIQRSFTLRDLTLRNVDLSTETIEFDFRPVIGDSSLTLDNGSLTSLSKPGFVPSARFTLTASGNSFIKGWTGRIASQTNLNVNPGATLVLDNCGQKNTDLVTSTLYFSQPSNVATINGGTLRLQDSNVTFGRAFFEDGQLSRMTFRNNAVLELRGEKPKLVADDIDFFQSTLALPSSAKLTVRSFLNLDTASVVVGDSSAISTPALTARGVSSIDLAELNPLFGGGVPVQAVTAGAVSIRPDARLTLTGKGALETGFLTFTAPGAGQQYGEVVVDGQAALMTALDGRILLPRQEVLTIKRTSPTVRGLLQVTKGGSIEYGMPNKVVVGLTNHGDIEVTDNGRLSFFGDATIGGADGLLWIGEDGVLGVGSYAASGAAAVNRLTTSNKARLDDFSTLQLALDPTNLTNDKVRVQGELKIAPLAGLNLSLVNDKVLPGGTKFVLIDYGSWTGLYLPGLKFFNGYPEGGKFTLGANTYQIKYADTGDGGYAGAITLTVVTPVPPVATLLPTTQTLNGMVGAPLAPSAALVPGNFDAPAPTYAINPLLPAGLRLAPTTGIISGTPTVRLGSTVYTITGVGSTSGIAAAQVTLAIALGNQMITFNQPPPAAYVPDGAFAINATASSGLPVQFDSATPTVCTVASNTVFTLSAGVCTIVASQPGNDNYNAAAPVSRSISIAKATPLLTLKADPRIVRIGESSVVSTKSASTGAITYLVSGPCTLVGPSLVQGSAVGSCSVTAVQASDGNYQAGQSSPITIIVEAVPTIPTLSAWGLLILASTLALVTGWRLRRQTVPGMDA